MESGVTVTEGEEEEALAGAAHSSTAVGTLPRLPRLDRGDLQPPPGHAANGCVDTTACLPW
jgi:hypothetical protein